MRKNAIVRLCIWSVVCLLLIGLLVSRLINDTYIFQSGNNFFLLSSYRYKNADSYTAGNTEISDRIYSIDIDWIDGSVTVLSYHGDTVRIREDGDITDSDHQLHWFLAGGTLYIKHSASKLFLSPNQSKNLTVEIPVGWASRLSSVKIESVSASILLGNIKTSELQVESVSGSIDIKKVDASTLKLDTVSGAITGTDLYIPLFDVETNSGAISLAGEIHQGSVDTTSGNVTLSSSVRFESLDLEAVSGDITLICPLESPSYLYAGYRVVFESVSGDIKSDISFKKNGNNYTFGSGGHVYNFESVSGDLILKEP